MSDYVSVLIGSTSKNNTFSNNVAAHCRESWDLEQQNGGRYLLKIKTETQWWTVQIRVFFFFSVHSNALFYFTTFNKNILFPVI